jgi:hypothetical protein
VPDVARHVFLYFLELSEVRQFELVEEYKDEKTFKRYVPLRINHRDIAAWASLRKVELEQWELDCIMAMDQELVDVKRKANSTDRIMDKPLDANIFDALF